MQVRFEALMPSELDVYFHTMMVCRVAWPSGYEALGNPPDGDDAALVLPHGHQEQHGLGLPLHVHEVAPRARARARVEEALAVQRARRASPCHLRHLVALRHRERHAVATDHWGGAGAGGLPLARRRRERAAAIVGGGAHRANLLRPPDTKFVCPTWRSIEWRIPVGVPL
jgi:hypothetical protein